MRLGKALRRLWPYGSSDSRPSHSRSTRSRSRSRSHSRTRPRSQSHQLVPPPTFLSPSSRPPRSDQSSSRVRNTVTRSPSGSPPKSPPRSQSYSSARPSVPSTRPPHPSAYTQERAVIAAARDNVLFHADKLNNLRRRLDAEPDDARIVLGLRHHRAELVRNLDGYFVARGSRSTAELPGVVTTVEETDSKLSELDYQILSEVQRFEHAAADIERQFVPSAEDQRVHICADADDALIELQLYDHSWGDVMDDNTRNKLRRAADLLRTVLQNAPVSRVSPIVDFDDFTELEITSSHPGPSSPHSPRQHPHINPGAYSPTSHKLAAPLRIKRSSSNTTATRSPSSQNVSANPVFPDFPQQQRQYQYQPQHQHQHEYQQRASDRVRNGTRAQHRTQKKTIHWKPPGSGNEEDPGTSVRNVMHRQRTLRDVAETAMNGPDDSSTPFPTLGSSFLHGLEIPMPTPPVSVSVSASTTSAPVTQSSVPHSTSASASRSASTSRGTGHYSMNAGAETIGINPTVSKNMSFASTLYHTNNARDDAISDEGVMLELSVVRGDGRCLFRSLVRCRAVAKGKGIPEEREEKEEADVLRLRAVAELKRHRQLLTNNMVIEGNFEQHVKKMTMSQTFGGEPELLMLAKVLHVPIAVYIAKGDRYRQIQVYGRWYRGDPLRILYHSDGVHYDALLPCR